MAELDLSIITVNYGTPDLINRLIESIRKYPPPLSYELIVVDNASIGNSIEIIRKANPDISILNLEKNYGFGGGNNRGVGISRGKVIALLNSDSEIEVETFSEPARYVAEHPEIGIVGIKVYTPERELEQTARGFPDGTTVFFGRSTFLGKLVRKFWKTGKVTGLVSKNFQVDPDRAEPYEVDWVAGAIMFIRREVWDELAGFDEDYFLYWEDADLCNRAKNAGYKTVYYPGSHILHVAGGTTSRDPAPAIRQFHKSAYIYLTKHVSQGPSFLRGFAWCALKLRAALMIVKARVVKFFGKSS